MTQDHETQAPTAISSVAQPYDAKAASRRIGLAMMAQADFLNSLSLVTPTGMSAAVVQELSSHLFGVGQFLSAGHGVAVVYDRQIAAAASLASSIFTADALRCLNVDIAGLTGDIDQEQNPVAAVLRNAIDVVDSIDPSVAYSVSEAIAPLLDEFMGDAPVDPMAT